MASSAGRTLRWAFLGRVPYGAAEGLQHRLREALKRRQGDEHLLLLEHPPVYTLGRNASEADIFSSRQWRAERGIEVAHCDRGGKVTYHGPGQLVGYPLLNLSPDRRDIRRYVRDLQEVLIRTLSDLGVAAERREGQDFIGVWAGGAKIASIGVHLSRWHTTHGFALNVTTDLAHFGGIVACGLAGVEMASVESLGAGSPALSDVAERCAHHFAEVFERRLVATAPQAIWEAGESAAEGIEAPAAAPAARPVQGAATSASGSSSSS